MSAPPPPARDRFVELLRAAVRGGTLSKLTLGKYRGPDATLRHLFARPITLKSGPQFSLVWRHETRDITKNHAPEAALALLEPLIGGDFLDAHLFTPGRNAQLETGTDGARLTLQTASVAPPAASERHDRAKAHLIPAETPWLHALGVTNEQGRPREGQSAKFRQINKFAELLTHLLPEAFPDFDPAASTGGPLRITDMGCGKGYLTFALATLLGNRARVIGVELRPELVAEGNRIAAAHRLSQLTFVAGRIASLPIEDRGSRIEHSIDLLIALHACDTATDDAIARGVAAGARLIVVSPCCQKELRPQLAAPPVLAPALRHGIFQERQAEFVTDALRALLLEWAGFRTKVFEFISTEHTAKNLMIAAVRSREPHGPDSAAARHVREFAAWYGIRSQRLATALGFPLNHAG